VGFGTAQYGVFERFQGRIHADVIEIANKRGFSSKEVAEGQCPVEDLHDAVWEAVLRQVRLLTHLHEVKVLVRETESLYEAELELRKLDEAELDVQTMCKVLHKVAAGLEVAGRVERGAGRWIKEADLLRDLGDALEDKVQGIGMWVVDKLIDVIRSYGRDHRVQVQLYEVKEVHDKDEREHESSTRFWNLFRAIGNAVDFNTDTLVFVVLIFCHAGNGGLVSMFLPILAILYGTQAVPRPPKDYWLFMMSYMCIVICLKYMAQLRVVCPDQYEYVLAQDGICQDDLKPDRVDPYLQLPYVLGMDPHPNLNPN